METYANTLKGNKMINLNDCLPTPLSECPKSIKAVLEDPNESLSYNDKYLKIKNEFSFLLRRLWTYSIIQEKSLMYVYTTERSTNFIGIKIDGEEEYIGEINIPFPLSHSEIINEIDFVAEKFNAVYCLKLTSYMNF